MSIESSTKAWPQTNGIRGFKTFLFGVILVIILMVILGILSRVNKDNLVTNFEQCTQSTGSHTVETYPSVCTTKDQKSFVNKAQQHVCGRIGFAANPNLCL